MATTGVQNGPSTGGDVATDTIWDAAGDLAVATAADTATKLAIGNAGSALSRINGAVAWNSGTSFPTAAAGDLFHRTDLSPGLWRYDGTRWRSEQVFSMTFPPTDVVNSVNASLNFGRLPVPWLSIFGIYGLRYTWFMLPATAHSGTNYYTCKINWATQADSDTQWGSTTLDSKTATTGSNNYVFSAAIDAVLNTTARQIKMRLDKVASAAGITYTSGMIHFQLIAT